MSTEGVLADMAKSGKEAFDFGEAFWGVGVEEAAKLRVGREEHWFGGFDDAKSFAGGDDPEVGGGGSEGAPEWFEASCWAVDCDKWLGEAANEGTDDVGAGLAGDGCEEADEGARNEGRIARAGEGELCVGVCEAGGEAGEGTEPGGLVGDRGEGDRRSEVRQSLAWGMDDDDAPDGGGDGIDDPLEEGLATEGR